MAEVQHRFVGIVPPSTPPSVLGAHYIDTAAKKSYTSVGTTSIDDWKEDAGDTGLVRVTNNFVFTSGGSNSNTYTIADNVDEQTLILSETMFVGGNAGGVAITLPLIANRTSEYLTVVLTGPKGMLKESNNNLMTINAAGPDLISDGTNNTTDASFLLTVTNTLMFVADIVNNVWLPATLLTSAAIQDNV